MEAGISLTEGLAKLLRAGDAATLDQWLEHAVASTGVSAGKLHTAPTPACAALAMSDAASARFTACAVAVAARTAAPAPVTPGISAPATSAASTNPRSAVEPFFAMSYTPYAMNATSTIVSMLCPDESVRVTGLLFV